MNNGVRGDHRENVKHVSNYLSNWLLYIKNFHKFTTSLTMCTINISLKTKAFNIQDFYLTSLLFRLSCLFKELKNLASLENCFKDFAVLLNSFVAEKSPV